MCDKGKGRIRLKSTIPLLQVLVVCSLGAMAVMGSWQTMKTKEGIYTRINYDVIVQSSQLGFYQSPASGGRCVTGQASEDDSMWSPSHGLHGGPWLGTR